MRDLVKQLNFFVITYILKHSNENDYMDKINNPLSPVKGNSYKHGIPVPRKSTAGAEISHPACRQLFCYKSGRGHIVNHGRVNEG